MKNEYETTVDIKDYTMNFNKKRRCQSYTPSLRTYICDHIDDRITTIMESSFDMYFNELERRSEIQLMMIMDNVYAALSKNGTTKTDEETRIIGLKDDEVSIFGLTGTLV